MKFFHIHLLHNHNDDRNQTHENSSENPDSNISIDLSVDEDEFSIDLDDISDRQDRHHFWTNKQSVKQVPIYSQMDSDD